jgi:hypothetical protein
MDVKCRISGFSGLKIPRTHFQDQKYRNGNIQAVTELMILKRRICYH